MVVVRGTLRLVAWCAALVVTLALLHRLPVPAGAVDLTSQDPADLVPLLLRAARLVALACAWYLTGATALSALAALSAWRPLRRLDAALTVPIVRHLVRAGVGASLAVGLGLGPATAAVAAPGPPGASAQPAPLAQLDDRPGQEVAGDAPAEDRVPSDDAPRAVAPPVVFRPEVVPTSASGSEDEAGTHEVVAGESFWSIAADLTVAELGRAPEDAEIVERWVALIEDNRDRLLVPDDPDLLMPGQVLRLPEGPR